MTEKPASPFAGLDKALLRSTQRQAAPAETPQDAEPVAAEAQVPTAPAPAPQTSKRTRDLTKKPAAKQARISDSKQASKLARPSDDLVETIRKAVKVPGREVSFVRLTPTEKGQLADIIYTYKRQGKKTSENEINRIAINYIIEDYQAHGEQSILAKVIESLLA